MATQDDQNVASKGRWFHPRTLLDRTFEIGIILKGLDGVIELIGAVLVTFVPAHTILHIASTLTANELAEDPNDFIAGHIVQYANELAGKDKWFAALFLLSHGLIKVVLVVGLLRTLAWAYPFAFVTLGAFVMYQTWLLMHHFTVGMLLLTLFDLFIIWLTWREYQKFKVERLKQKG